jgi:hypothetical protein
MHPNILSALKIGQELSHKQREERIEEYNKKPVLCTYCNQPLIYDSIILRKWSLRKGKITNVFCNHTCAAKFNNAKRCNRQCLNCGQHIKTNKYCSKACATKYRRTILYTKIENGEKVDKNIIKSFLIERYGRKCSICQITEWCGKPILLITDHIDGNAENNKVDNLRLVCSNCDAQLPTYKGKNAGKGRFKRKQRYREGKSY